MPKALYEDFLAFNSDGTVVAWGRTNEGQVNIPDYLQFSIPCSVAGDLYDCTGECGGSILTDGCGYCGGAGDDYVCSCDADLNCSLECSGETNCLGLCGEVSDELCLAHENKNLIAVHNQNANLISGSIIEALDTSTNIEVGDEIIVDTRTIEYVKKI